MKETLHLSADRPQDVHTAAQLLRAGALVGFATETVYGLGASALDPVAVAGIFAAKGRPAWDPLIVHVPGLAQALELVALDEPLRRRVERLAAALWPGPLTLLLPRRAVVPDAVTAGRALVGIRVPAHPGALQLLREAGVPVAAPSANRFGHVSPTTAEHVLTDLRGRIDAVLDAGACAVGVESTVLDPAPSPMVIYRSGAVTAAILEEVCGVAASVYQPPPPGDVAPVALPSPGVGLRHYAPEVPVVLTEGTPSAVFHAVAQAWRAGRPGVLWPENWPVPEGMEATLHRWGDWDAPAELAARLFAGLRALEALQVCAIVCPLPAPGGLRDALRDRLEKAARPR